MSNSGVAINIGYLCTAPCLYYDSKLKSMKTKRRPVLIIAQADNGDYNALPMSSVKNRSNIDPDYDIELDPIDYPNLGLANVSYVRVHKQFTTNCNSLLFKVDLKSEYPDLFVKIMNKLKEYNLKIINEAFK